MASKSHIFREYFGAKNNQTTLSLVPNTRQVPFHFMLAFATDYDDHGSHTNGAFKPQWKPDFGYLLDFMNKNDNAKVILSIGWYDDKFPFKLTDKAKWVSNAYDSISKIINENNLDGLDINYWKIDSPEEDFVDCVGELIQKFKDENIAEIVSISPCSYLKNFYTKLYEKYNKFIDLVDYKFYALSEGEDLKNVAKLREAIDEVQKLYGLHNDAKLVIGFSTDSKDKGRLPEKVLFQTYAQKAKQLRGISVWCADDSPSPFKFEENAQKKLDKYNAN